MENTIPENPILRSSGVLHAESEQPTNASTLFDPLNFELAFASFQLLDLAPAIKTPQGKLIELSYKQRPSGNR
jgi:hypothetical protein